MSHKVSVWQHTQLPNVQLSPSPCFPSCSNLPNCAKKIKKILQTFILERIISGVLSKSESYGWAGLAGH